MILQLVALPEELNNTENIKHFISLQYGILLEEIGAIQILKKSIDARKKPVKINLTVEVFSPADLPHAQKLEEIFANYKNVHHAREVAIVGAGPAGLFAALQLLELGLKPVIFERGKTVQERRRDLANIFKENTINPESNYCFGEGGAGTYSDGKLYTRSSKRGDVRRILKILVAHGAAENILYESHPHIGTNKLPQIIINIRKTILQYGGEIHFNAKVSDFIVKNNTIAGLQINGNTTFAFGQVILATGHSARDIYELLQRKNILIEAKPFALGVRIEHPQALIDQIQYTCGAQRPDLLPAASYSLVQQVDGRGVFSFCMCPGGIIAPAMTAPGEIVVNGWSPSKRNNPFANSGMVVSVGLADFKPFAKYGALAGLYFQAAVEQKCCVDQLKAPAQGMMDFIQKKTSSLLPASSYLPGTLPVSLDEFLPPFVSQSLRGALKIFGQKMRGYASQEAILLAAESRTSSPVRIVRDKSTLEHPQIKGLYPCAEGAGYAGGIVSAAMDGENCAKALVLAK